MPQLELSTRTQSSADYIIAMFGFDFWEGHQAATSRRAKPAALPRQPRLLQGQLFSIRS
jgi:hypothetical protein